MTTPISSAGADTHERLGPVRVTSAGLISPAALRKGMAVVIGLAGLVGLYLVYVGGWPILLVGVAAILGALGLHGWTVSLRLLWAGRLLRLPVLWRGRRLRHLLCPGVEPLLACVRRLAGSWRPGDRHSRGQQLPGHRNRSPGWASGRWRFGWGGREPASSMRRWWWLPMGWPACCGWDSISAF